MCVRTNATKNVGKDVQIHMSTGAQFTGTVQAVDGPVVLFVPGSIRPTSVESSLPNVCGTSGLTTDQIYTLRSTERP